ncbi:hypothetical protein CYLTODRAFT_55401 [Cylindrobasidium torrendii FP15055 ss-10]|uniref:Protein CPL1-like domain-containing protein n=1 Tax=Cylindrobasidium torrendii FP15055 ss-10 TaxID=1314674 RepID=A0A0D7BQ24_9AGAR|nr:hypothetical protein CYLTODRAFT_55401 [Cylindrobasidium torrendii FP15055 ss-10]
MVSLNKLVLFAGAISSAIATTSDASPSNLPAYVARGVEPSGTPNYMARGYEPSGTPAYARRGEPSGTPQYARRNEPSGTPKYAARGATPSQDPQYKRSESSVTPSRRTLQQVAIGDVYSCPEGYEPCPLSANDPEQGYDCVATMYDVDNCGGCAALGRGGACMDEEGVKGATCTLGHCTNHSCLYGYTLYQGQCL